MSSGLGYRPWQKGRTLSKLSTDLPDKALAAALGITVNALRLRRWRRTPPGRDTDQHVVWRCQRDYKITLEDFELLYEAQGGCCAICEGEESVVGELQIDHDHATGRIRGLVCPCCNKAMGLIKDVPEVARAMAAYLAYFHAYEEEA